MIPKTTVAQLFLWALLIGASVPAAPAAAAPALPLCLWQSDDWLGPEERAEVARMLRRGELAEALPLLEELLGDAPDDAPVRLLYARALRLAGRYAEARDEARAALGALLAPDAKGHDAALVRAGALDLAGLLTDLGEPEDALTVLDAAPAADPPDPREAWQRGRALRDLGRREEARARFSEGAQATGKSGWEAELAKARCQRALGDVERAAETLVRADRAARGEEGVEPDVLVELGQVYFEFYGEVDDPVGNAHSPRRLYDEALELAPGHEGALLGLFELHRFNWNRSSRSPGEILDDLFEANPASLEGRVARVSAALDDGDLRLARATLDELGRVAPKRRDVRAQEATLAWIEHRREEARATLDALAAVDPADSNPARELGRHLLELYRFAEGRPFLEEAVERDPTDYRAWRELGRSQANTGDEEAARETLDKAAELARGRRDAWRDNLRLVLARMQESFVEHATPELVFAWLPDAAFVLQTYLEPFYREARLELAERYGFTPDPVRIEVFRRWVDFSVRSTGFAGFPALGVCFGPVVTAVSPLAEQLRGNFSWARTSYHEFTHVIHLGLSHNRCPRWVTEGLATWEEGRKNPAWWRNYRRELVDAHANGAVIPVRRLNGAFRGPRVLFAYYQSGLLCKLLIEEHGFRSMVRMLEAFDAGKDLDQTLREVYETTPEALDRRFDEYVATLVAELRIEPRWTRERTFRRRFELDRRAPEEPAALEAWKDAWCQVAWGDWGADRRVDAEEVLRLVAAEGPLPPRGLFLRAELHLARSEEDEARAALVAGLAAGGEDFRARMALAALALGDEDVEGALVQLAKAEENFPGFDEAGLSAELRTADLLERQGERAGAMAARQRWLDWNAGDDEVRLRVARWRAESGEHEAAVRLYGEANEVDPFRRSLHLDWARSLHALERREEALRECTVGLRIPRELERELRGAPAPGDAPGEAGVEVAEWEALAVELEALQARVLLELGRVEEARAAAERALVLDPGCTEALEVLDESSD